VTTARAGLLVALAAVLVQGPRLVLTLLAADRIAVPPAWTAALLAGAGVGTTLALTGGNIYLAHVLFTVRRRRRLLAVLWAGALVCTAVLVTPQIVAGLDGKPLVEVLASEPSRWGWGLVAALAHELVAASCMLAAAAAQHQQHELSRLTSKLAQQAAELRELRARQQLQPARRSSAPAPAAAAGQLVSCRNGCGYEGTTMGERGHQRACPQNGRGLAS